MVVYEMKIQSSFANFGRLSIAVTLQLWIFLCFLMTTTRWVDGFVIVDRHPVLLRRYSRGSRPANFHMTTTDAESNTPQQDALLNLLSPPAACDVDRMSSTDLAYIGDVVYEMLVRSNKVWPPKRTSDLQQKVVRLVRAEYQSAMLARLRENDSDDTGPTFSLTQNEERVLKRGRNAGSKTNHRKSNPAAYQDATALEALIGYLYISDRPRCTRLLQWIEFNLDRIQF